VSTEISQRRAYNAASDFIDASVSAGRGDAVAFIDPERSITYGELQEQTYRFGAALRALGLKRERRLVVALQDTVAFPAVFWGALRAGIVAVPFNTRLSERQYAYMLADTRASAIVMSAALAELLRPAIEGADTLRTVILVGAGDGVSFKGCEVINFADLMATHEPETVTADTLADEVAFWIYTSGSTGDPKAVRHVHSSPMAAARLMGQGVLGINAEDVVFSAAKLCFSYGLGNAMLFPMSVGARAILLPERPTPEAVLDIMSRHRPSVFYAVPSLYTALLARPDLPGGAGSDRLRICVSAGEAMPRQIGEHWREVVGVDVLDGIGSSEMLQTFLSNQPGAVRHGTTGKPVPGYDIKLVDDSGCEVAPGVVGELLVRGPTAGDDYWNQRAKTRSTFLGEWTRSGDTFTCDDDGYYHYCGRADDMFKVNGLWVSPFEVEDALVAHAAVREAAVIARKDADGLVRPMAFVVLSEGFADDETLLEDLKDHVRELTAPWKAPHWISVRRELPRTATGKVQRFKLRQEDAGEGG